MKPQREGEFYLKKQGAGLLVGWLVFRIGAGVFTFWILDFGLWIILRVLGASRVFCFFALVFLSVLCGSVLNFFYLRVLRGSKFSLWFCIVKRV